MFDSWPQLNNPYDKLLSSSRLFCFYKYFCCYDSRHQGKKIVLFVMHYTLWNSHSNQTLINSCIHIENLSPNWRILCNFHEMLTDVLKQYCPYLGTKPWGSENSLIKIPCKWTYLYQIVPIYVTRFDSSNSCCRIHLKAFLYT